MTYLLVILIKTNGGYCAREVHDFVNFISYSVFVSFTHVLRRK